MADEFRHALDPVQPVPLSLLGPNLWPQQPHIFLQKLSCAWFLLVLQISAQHAITQITISFIEIPMIWNLGWVQKVSAQMSHRNVHSFSAFEYSGMKRLRFPFNWCHTFNIEVPSPSLSGWWGRVSQIGYLRPQQLDTMILEIILVSSSHIQLNLSL